MVGKGGYVYIISNKNRSVYYTGVTSELYNRINQHKNGKYNGFSKKYNCTDLIYYEVFDHIDSAIEKEKQMKKWKRSWKERAIMETNPSMIDLFESIKEFNYNKTRHSCVGRNL